MAKKIKWTTEAEISYDSIIAYLKKEWTEKQVINFIAATDIVIAYIETHPYMFRKSEKKQIHEALVTKHNLLLYRIKKTHIELLVFWDTRRNPKKKITRKK